MDGSQVWGAYQAGRLDDIRNYCETDAANTYLVYLGFQRMRGMLEPAQHNTERELVRATLAKSKAPHWKEFLDQWPAVL
jgi:predicted PolB exonuclease-like 3'-5' exonuclease